LTPYHKLLKVVLALCAALLAAPCSAESKKAEPKEPTASPSTPRVVKQINKVNEDNSYTVGYESEDGSFKIETRDSEGNIKGMFAYVDSSGQLKRIAYSTRPEDAFPELGTNKLLPVTEASSAASASTRKPPTVRRQLRYRRPQDTESPEDPTPVLSMLLRRSRQGVPARSSDADELLRIQQQQHQLYNVDSGDIYGTGYHAPEGQLRQHLMRGRVQNAVLRQLSPGQLQELQQYVNPEARRALNPAVRALMSPVLDYLQSNGREHQQDFSSYDPYFFYQQQQAYPHPFYYRNGNNQYYAPQHQNYGLYEDLRQSLIQRMLLAARLLGVEGMLPSRAFDADQYGDRLLGQRFYTQPDPRLAYNLRTLPYQHALQVAREMHERQLAAYQASIAAQGGVSGSRAYPRREHLEDQQPSFIINPATYAPDAVGHEYDYSTVTPSSVRSTTASQRGSNIQRVRNVQVITAATASPSSTTAASPTTPRRY
jgi:hypothetical protein